MYKLFSTALLGMGLAAALIGDAEAAGRLGSDSRVYRSASSTASLGRRIASTDQELVKARARDGVKKHLLNRDRR